MTTTFKLGGYRPDPKNKPFIEFSKTQVKSSIRSSILDSQNIDLRPFSSPLHFQGNSNSCCANSVIKALEIKRIEKYGIQNHIDLSRADLYFGARDLMNPKETHIDEGTHISLCCDVLRKFGVCRESSHPFIPQNIFIPPPVLATREARLNRIDGHFKITSAGNQRIDDIILNLYNKNPVVLGTQVDDSWFSYNSKSPPLRKCKNVKGLHAICCVGFINGWFLIENSWGNWGVSGYAFIDPAVISDPNITTDLWVMSCDFDLFWEGK